MHGTQMPTLPFLGYRLHSSRPHIAGAPPTSPLRLPSATAMARLISRALPLASRMPPVPISFAVAFLRWQQPLDSSASPSPSSIPSLHQQRCFQAPSRGSRFQRAPGIVLAQQRGLRKMRWSSSAKKKADKKQAVKDKELELKVSICIEDELPNDPEVMEIAEMLKLNAPLAMKIALDGLSEPDYKTRDTSISDVSNFERVELSLMLCNDEFIRSLNKEWRDEDRATDVLSMSQHIPDLDVPFLMLGDIVISVETATRQAKERGHTLLDEIRILLVHGLLHLLGFDHELSSKAEEEMEKEEELILKSLGWKGKGLIKSANDAAPDETVQDGNSNGTMVPVKKKEGSLRFYKPKFQYIFCDMDGTLLNSKSQITSKTAEALKEARSRGVKIVVATGKARPAVIRALKSVGLSGKDGIVSEVSPGVFLQGLLVYGRQGREIVRKNLEPSVCREAFLYSLKHEVPLVAFCQDRCLTLFGHPSIESLHTVYHEPKAEVMPSLDRLLSTADVQKLLFFGTPEDVSSQLRPHWMEATKDRAGVTQAQADMLEIIPYGTSKGIGVKMLLDHLGATEKEVMAIGDGENDVEMLQLASFSVALSNGSEKAKSVAHVVGSSNDDDGAAEAIYKYAF